MYDLALLHVEHDFVRSSRNYPLCRATQFGIALCTPPACVNYRGSIGRVEEGSEVLCPRLSFQATD
eukprot:COSAG01_NODE_3588_length_5905_cov_3.425594_2_plen_66_part_00